jgi:hypothetical protein
MQHLSHTRRLVELAAGEKHNDVRVDPVSLHRLIAWVDSCGVSLGEEDLRAQGVPDFPGIDRMPIRPRVANAPVTDEDTFEPYVESRLLLFCRQFAIVAQP